MNQPKIPVTSNFWRRCTFIGAKWGLLGHFYGRQHLSGGVYLRVAFEFDLNIPDKSGVKHFLNRSTEVG